MGWRHWMLSHLILHFLPKALETNWKLDTLATRAFMTLRRIKGVDSLVQPVVVFWF